MRKLFPLVILGIFILADGKLYSEEPLQNTQKETVLENKTVTESTSEESVQVPELLSALKAEIKIGTGIENREIFGEAESFVSTEVPKIYCWTAISGAAEPTKVIHKWYLGEDLVSEVPLEIKYPRHRTYSSKTILPEMKGSWKVIVVDDKGNVLNEKSFVIE